MHSAPSVIYPVGRSRNAERLLFALWLLGVCAVIVAAIQSAGIDWRDGMLLLCAIIATVAAWTGVFRTSGSANLIFDGQCWSMSGGIELPAAQAAVMLDLQRLLLVRLRGTLGATRWIWVERDAMPGRWRDLRRALYSRAIATDAAVGTPESVSADAHHRSP
jgi:toxin CptA